MLQGLRLLQPPKSCWFPLCLICFDGKIKTKIKRLWPASTNTVIFQLHMQINFTNLTFLHSSFKLWAAPSTNAHKTSSIKQQHTIKITGPNSEVWIRLYQ
jgi:hypothetical protein